MSFPGTFGYPESGVHAYTRDRGAKHLTVFYRPTSVKIAHHATQANARYQLRNARVQRQRGKNVAQESTECQGLHTPLGVICTPCDVEDCADVPASTRRLDTETNDSGNESVRAPAGDIDDHSEDQTPCEDQNPRYCQPGNLRTAEFDSIEIQLRERGGYAHGFWKEQGRCSNDNRVDQTGFQRTLRGAREEHPVTPSNGTSNVPSCTIAGPRVHVIIGYSPCENCGYLHTGVVTSTGNSSESEFEIVK